jgi:hypothetical protein
VTEKPNHQKLIIPGKNSTGAHPGYATDSRTIEQWANEGIVRKLIAGSGVTLSPSDGIDMGQGVEVSASGGGGTNMGILTLSGGYDGLDDGPIWGVSAPSPTSDADVFMFPDAPRMGGPTNYSNGGFGWFVFSNAGLSVNLLPEIFVPAFTGATGLGVLVEMWAWSIDGTNGAHYYVNTGSPLDFASNTNYQLQPTDLVEDFNFGGDLTMTAGSGSSGNGLITASGIPYIASVNLTVSYMGAIF